MPRVYAVGDVTGGPQFTHSSWHDHRLFYDLTGTPLNLKLVLDALLLGVTAAGGWVVVRRLAFGENVPPNPSPPAPAP